MHVYPLHILHWFFSLLLVISTQLLHVLLVLVFLHLKQMFYGTFNVYCNHSPEKGFSCTHLISTVQNLLNITSMHFFFACSALQDFLFVIYCCRFRYESFPSILDLFLHFSSEKTLVPVHIYLFHHEVTPSWKTPSKLCGWTAFNHTLFYFIF